MKKRRVFLIAGVLVVAMLFAAMSLFASAKPEGAEMAEAVDGRFFFPWHGVTPPAPDGETVAAGDEDGDGLGVEIGDIDVFDDSFILSVTGEGVVRAKYEVFTGSRLVRKGVLTPGVNKSINLFTSGKYVIVVAARLDGDSATQDVLEITL
ncbi:MAG: hypothetical protein OD814_001169 [Candidatus Alkanophagales archaeon MCA70_species_1]|nr:hypothetical protein [Candidatus Alkanophaga volatiphilum]